jgi:hypothetical protein
MPSVSDAFTILRLGPLGFLNIRAGRKAKPDDQ